MADDENFANHPISIAQARAERAENGALWTPRDALIDMLRDLDSGKLAVEDICIVHRSRDPEGGFNIRFSIAGPSPRAMIVGMLEWAKTTIIMQPRNDK